jgi:hypothetical protein
VFAAIAPSPNFYAVAEDGWDKLKELGGLPVVVISGWYDQYLPISSEATIGAVRNYQRINGVNVQDFGLSEVVYYTTSEHPAIAKTGIPFEKTEVQYHDGTAWAVGEYFNQDGICVIRAAAVSGMPHWPSGYWARFNWDFLKHWSRDARTQQLVYSK